MTPGVGGDESLEALALPGQATLAEAVLGRGLPTHEGDGDRVAGHQEPLVNQQMAVRLQGCPVRVNARREIRGRSYAKGGKADSGMDDAAVPAPFLGQLRAVLEAHVEVGSLGVGHDLFLDFAGETQHFQGGIEELEAFNGGSSVPQFALHSFDEADHPAFFAVRQICLGDRPFHWLLLPSFQVDGLPENIAVVYE